MSSDTSRFPIGDHCIVERVRTTFDIQPVVDMHTHLYAPAFDRGAEDGDERLLLYGIDELLAYHYFVDEVFRVLEPGSLTPAAFWAMPTPERADLVWRNLFVERPPVSEACVGLIDILTSLGLDPAEPDLAGYRSWFAARDIDTHIDEVMRLSGVERIVMTNEPFSDLERPRWEAGVDPDPRFAAVVRVDRERLVELGERGVALRRDLRGDGVQHREVLLLRR